MATFVNPHGRSGPVHHDWRGAPVSGASAQALHVFESALLDFQAWRGDPAAGARRATALAPGFVMAHVLEGYLCILSRDPASVQAAKPVLARCKDVPANARERSHLAVLRFAVDDDYQCARQTLDQLLHDDPRDVLALQAAHAMDYITGDLEQMRVRIEQLLPAWDTDLPGYFAVESMYAFALQECGDFAAAETAALHAIELNILDARAHHTMAHVYEMTGRAEAGLAWLLAHRDGWAGDTFVASHCLWHQCLFHLALGQREAALTLYDACLAPRDGAPLGLLIDASALLWRLGLEGVDCGARWDTLATGWSPRVRDGFCTFNDLHAMMAFAGAEAWQPASRLFDCIEEHCDSPCRYGVMSQSVGAPAAQALLAFGRGDYAGALALLAELPPVAQRLGGSHAQRDVLHLTLIEAVNRLRLRPWDLALAA